DPLADQRRRVRHRPDDAAIATEPAPEVAKPDSGSDRKNDRAVIGREMRGDRARRLAHVLRLHCKHDYLRAGDNVRRALAVRRDRWMSRTEPRSRLGARLDDAKVRRRIVTREECAD